MVTHKVCKVASTLQARVPDRVIGAVAWRRLVLLFVGPTIEKNLSAF